MFSQDADPYVPANPICDAAEAPQSGSHLPLYTLLELMHSRMLTLKTAFLEVITSARRLSELQALSVQQPYTNFFLDKLVLHTKAVFLSRVVNPFHIGQSINLPAFFALTHSGRETNPKNC